jgi:hypothetical protein
MVMMQLYFSSTGAHYIVPVHMYYYKKSTTKGMRDKFVEIMGNYKLSPFFFESSPISLQFCDDSSQRHNIICI